MIHELVESRILGENMEVCFIKFCSNHSGSPKVTTDLSSFVGQVSKGLEVKNYELCPYWVR